MVKAFNAFSLPPFIPVKEQIDPDPEFPTVDFPNPEEGKGAFTLAMKTADKENIRIILATDPDSDRLAIAEKDQKTNEWRIFTGNQIGILFADYIWTHYRKQNPNADPSKCMMAASTVSSKMVKAMAKKEGFQFVGTLSGFKWMGNVAADFEARGHKFLFAYEVEIGFLIGNLSLDKDGIRAAVMFYEMANQLFLQGKTLSDQLQILSKKYGYFQMNTSYFFSTNPDVTAAIFHRMRTMNNGKYADKCGNFKISTVRDISLGYDNSKPNNVSVLPKLTDQHMITFRFENGCVATLRFSGTEPKLKYYIECCSEESEEKARKLVDEMTAVIIKEFLQPEANKLIPKKVS